MTCPTCGAALALQDRYCESCGAAVTAPGHRETDLGAAAAVTDRGKFRPVNEDAYAVHAGAEGLAAVVCDGVSTTSGAGLAAEAACRAAMERLVKGLGTTDNAELAGEAVAAGQDAARMEEGATTITLGLIVAGEIVVANVGDSRAYWIGVDGGHRLLSIDDSGRPHEITAWLGADGDPVVPHVNRIGPDRPGVLVLCSDGLWNYADKPAAVARLLPGHTAYSAAGAAGSLVAAALAAGGADNVTVAVLEHRGGNDGH